MRESLHFFLMVLYGMHVILTENGKTVIKFWRKGNQVGVKRW
jgi:hypothetical protein